MVDIYVEKIGEMWFGVAFEKEIIYTTAFGSTEKSVLRGLSEGVHHDVSIQNRRTTDFAKNVIKTLKDIYDGKEVPSEFAFTQKHLSTYAMKVIETVCKVPVGYVTSYGEVAKAVGGGPRAVGQIMARNPFAPICPCHRVVRSDFTLGGYGGGLNVKLAFLKREKRGYSSKKEIVVNSKKLQVFPVEFAIRKAEEG
jgi:methylated-DNA-[protein]-cysteine S-methyltransferase